MQKVYRNISIIIILFIVLYIFSPFNISFISIYISPALADDGDNDGDGDSDSDSDSDNDSDNDSDSDSDSDNGNENGGDNNSHGGSNSNATSGSGGMRSNPRNHGFVSHRYFIPKKDLEKDHDYAWRARKRGYFRPFKTIKKWIRLNYGGRILEVKIKKRNGQIYYEVKIIDKYNRIRKLYIPASHKKSNFKSRKY